MYAKVTLFLGEPCIITSSEPMTRIELVTSSLPRKRSSTELHRQIKVLSNTSQDSFLSRKALSGRRDSNSRPSAWKADALPTELLPHIIYFESETHCGESRIRTCEDIVSRFTVCPRWPLEYLPNTLEPMEGLEPPTC